MLPKIRKIRSSKLSTLTPFKAIEDFTKVIQSNPESSSAYFNRGCCYDSKGMVNQAIADYSIALQIDSQNKKNSN